MEGKRLIEKIRLRNILSFGDKAEEIELQPLNIIIGQNASGKSNLVDVIKLLRSLPQNKGLINFISRNGGISEWIWKGKKTDYEAVITVHSKMRKRKRDQKEYYFEPISYEIGFAMGIDQRTNFVEEFIKSSKETRTRSKLISEKKDIKPEDSVLLTLSNASSGEWFPESYYFELCFQNFIVYSELSTSRSSDIRKPQTPDAPNKFLEEDASNLALVLNDLEHRGDTKDIIVENLKKFNPRIKDYSIRILGGTVQLFIREEGLEKPISAMRLSDGTLRYLCLLAILCHPEPPPLICIEEPEVGLHPDILPTIAELMKEASQRTQLIVTTHSDILVSAFSDMPEAVLVCEKDEDGTHFKRLEADKLKVWLEEYTLGEAWLRGAIGGTRW